MRCLRCYVKHVESHAVFIHLYTFHNLLKCVYLFNDSFRKNFIFNECVVFVYFVKHFFSLEISWRLQMYEEKNKLLRYTESTKHNLIIHDIYLLQNEFLLFFSLSHNQCI